MLDDAACALVDAAGVELCLKFHGLQRGRCRFGAECHRSHKAPCDASLPIHRQLLDAKDAAEAAQRAAEAEQQRAIEASEAARPLPPWLHAARAELRFDAPSAIGMAAAARAFLECDSLERLHEVAALDAARPPACPTLISAYKRARRALPKSWREALLKQTKTLKRLNATPAYAAFLDAYRAFVNETVVPHIGSPVVYQFPPTLRVSMPGSKCIDVHTDADYARHESAEINYWVPLTDVAASNTLFLESRPGEGDYRPVEMRLGTGLRFDGQRCRHYTKADAAATTRVSFDFRVVPATLFRDVHGGRCGDYGVEAT